MVSKKEFKSEVSRLAARVNAQPKQIRIRSLKNKTGSCSPSSVITFDIGVLELNPVLRKEVIIHELLHLRYKNHGKLFKMMLATYLNSE